MHLHYGYHTSLSCNSPARYNKLVVGLGGVVVGGSSTTLEVIWGWCRYKLNISRLTILHEARLKM
jgi:hypothetical protein